VDCILVKLLAHLLTGDNAANYSLSVNDSTLELFHFLLEVMPKEE